MSIVNVQIDIDTAKADELRKAILNGQHAAMQVAEAVIELKPALGFSINSLSEWVPIPVSALWKIVKKERPPTLDEAFELASWIGEKCPMGGLAARSVAEDAEAE